MEENQTCFSQYPPMYLYDFLRQLKPLSASQVPKSIVMEPDEIAYSYVDRKTAQKYIKDLPPQGEYFMLYASKKSLLNLQFLDVTTQVEYMNSLKTPIKVPGEDHEYSLLAAALFEAVYLFDLLQTIGQPDVFAPLGGYEELRAVYWDNNRKKAMTPVLSLFEETPLNMRIFAAQTRYFFAKYIECRFPEYALAEVPDDVITDFEDLITEQITKIGDGNCWKSKQYTGIENMEFDGFTQKLELMLLFNENEIRDLLMGRKTKPLGKPKQPEKTNKK